MKSLVVSLVVAAFFLLFTGCGIINDDENPCGLETTWTDDLKDDYLFEESGSVFHNLVYENVETPEDICTEKHVSVEFDVVAYDEASLNEVVVIDGKVYWGGFYEEEVALIFNADAKEWTGTINDIGLKQAFPNEPGWIGIQIKVNLPTSADTNWVKTSIKAMEINLNYSKEPL